MFANVSQMGSIEVKTGLTYLKHTIQSSNVEIKFLKNYNPFYQIHFDMKYGISVLKLTPPSNFRLVPLKTEVAEKLNYYPKIKSSSLWDILAFFQVLF